MFIVNQAASILSPFSRLLTNKNEESTMNRDLVDSSSGQQTDAASEEPMPDKVESKNKDMIYTKTRVLKFDSQATDDVLEIASNDVDILLEGADRSKSTNKIIFREMARHFWDKKFYFGKMIDLTFGQEYIAYVIQRKDGIERRTIGIRVTELSNTMNQIIKTDNEDIVDLSFSQDRSRTVLSFITKSANVYIYQINNLKTKLECKKCVVIAHRNVSDYSADYLKIFWCPYDRTFDNTSSTRVFTCIIGKTAYIYDLNNLPERKEIDSDEIKSDLKFEIRMNDEIIFAVLSPDATTVAYTTASGDVNFYKLIFFKSTSPELLFNWKPHEKVAVTNLFFLNGPMTNDEDPTCWSFVVTINEKNELKLWSCDDWKCIQTIRFKGSQQSLRLQISIDINNEFIFISDLNHNRLIVIPIERNESICFIRNVYQYYVKDTILSLCAAQFQPSEEDTMASEMAEAALSASFGYDINETAFNASNSAHLVFYFIEQKTICKGQLVLKMNNTSSELFESKMIDDMTLMTPDDFNVSETVAGCGINDTDSALSSLVVETTTATTSITTATGLTNGAAVTTIASTTAVHADSSNADAENYGQDKLIHFTSSSSSPSREVEEILSVRPGNENILGEYYDDNCNDSVTVSEPKSWSDIPMIKSNVVIENEQIREAAVAAAAAASAVPIPEKAVVSAMPTKKMTVATVTTKNCQSNAEESVTTEQFPHALSNSLTAASNVVEAIKESPANLYEQKKRQSQPQSQLTDNKLQQQQQQQLFDLLEKQTSMVMQLQQEIRSLNDRFNKDNVELLKKNDASIDKISDRVNKIYLKHEKKSRDDIRNIVMEVVKTENGKTPATAQILSDPQGLQKLFQNSVSNALKPELIRQVFNAEMEIGFQNIERVLGDQVTKAVTSKQFISNFTKTISGSLKSVIEQILSDEISLRFVPAVEKICCEMFKQIHANFEKGTAEYLNVIDRKIGNIADPNINEFPLKEMESIVNKSITSKMADFTNIINSEIKKMTSDLERNFTHTLSSSLLNSSNQTSAVQSRSSTPSKSPRVMALKALSIADYNTAFHIALTNTNLELVNEICLKVSPVQMFHEKNVNALQPNVIVALLQQLSQDLFNNTKLKLEYLEEALTSFTRIIKAKQINRTMLDQALKTIRRMLNKYRKSDPDSLYSSRISRIELMIESFLQKIPLN